MYAVDEGAAICRAAQLSRASNLKIAAAVGPLNVGKAFEVVCVGDV